MSGNRWDQPGVPHKGWHCVDVVDLRADGESADETDYATCQMCGNELAVYRPGSWGPPEAYDLLARDGRRWLNEEASMLLEKEN